MSSDNVRLFIGARISMAAVQGLGEAVAAAREAGTGGELAIKWVAPASYHVTLKFIGWTRPEAIYAIRDAIGEALAGVSAFGFEVRGAGAFPKPERARVLWAGVPDPDGRFADLAQRIDRALEPLGYQAETRAFHPHVTLARVKTPGDVSGILDALSEQVYRDNWLDSVVLYESVMKRSGSEYSVRATWPLEEGSKSSRRQTAAVKGEATD